MVGNGAFMEVTMGWQVYNRAIKTNSYEFRSEYAKYRGWLDAAQVLHPTDAWKLRSAMGLKCAASALGGQCMNLAILTHIHTQDCPSPHPDRQYWKLDQDRRMNGEQWPLTL